MNLKKIFSPEDWISVPSKATPVQQPTSGGITSLHFTDELKRVEAIVSSLENECIDITSGYDNWLKVGFSLASEFGEGGRDFFHRISRLNSVYNYQDADTQYTKCVNSQGSGITIATFYQMAKDAGVDISVHRNGTLDFWKNGSLSKDSEEKNLNQKSKNPEVQADHKWILEECELPHFPQSVYDSLPPFLFEIIKTANSVDERDMLLMGSIACISVTLQNVSGKYHNDYWHPMLYFFVLADAGMGKGTLTYCRQLVAPIHKELRECSEKKIREYRIEKRKNNMDTNSSYEDEPKRHTLFIPTNSSSAAFIEQLDNNQGIGLLFDTECDTLSTILKTDYGDYSNILRKAYHHEPIDMNRRKDNEYRIVERPMLALCLSGTPAQLHTLTPDTENGLFSRILYYHMPFKVEFADTLNGNDDINDDFSLSEKFYQLGENFKRMRDAFMLKGEYHVVVPQHLSEEFNRHFRTLNEQVVEDVSKAMQGIVRRLAFATFRIIMVLTSIRYMDNISRTNYPSSSNVPIKLICNDGDFRCAISIADTLIYHSIYCYTHLPKTISEIGVKGKIVTKSDKMNKLFEALPNTFDKSEYTQASEKLGFPASTTSKWINSFIMQGRLERINQNSYKKIGIK